ncbi:MAG: hypothetical protein AVDCRST_MAG67-4172, partial [uncultured Solirubrobacteraceae bacterium]
VELHAPRHDRVRRRASRDRGLRGVPEDRRALGAPADVPELRQGRLLRQLAQPPRHRASRGVQPPGRPLRRARRGLELVLPRRDDVPPAL